VRTLASAGERAEQAERQRGSGLPRLLPEGFAAGPASLAEHRARYGPPPSAVGAADRAALLEQVRRSGLTGRGGAGFPVAVKLAAVAAGQAPVVVANGTEGEPGSAKDKILLARSPHLVLDGAVLAAGLVGARRVIVNAHPSVARIVAEAAAQRRPPGPPRPGRVRIRVVEAAGDFVAGEARAVVNWLGHREPVPVAAPPRLSERGLGGAPTLVQNVETLAHLALIGRYGAAWFRSAGTPQEPGSMLVTVLGAVREPAVHEIAIGTPLGAILARSGGADRPLQALLIGGYFGSWIPADGAGRLPFSRAGLAPAGADIGAGLIAALPRDACGLAETARLARYLAGSSAGQCGPCLFGLDAIAGQLERIAAGSSSDQRLLRRWLGQVDGRGACSHPDGAVRLVRSALTVFEAELADHAAGWCCGTAAGTILPVPPGRPR